MESDAAQGMISDGIQVKTRKLKKSEIFFKKRLTNQKSCDIINIVVRAVTQKALRNTVGV